MKRYLLALASTLLLLVGCSATPSKETVTIYVSEDQVFSQPLLKDFEKETGITVRAIYDTEESKSTGVMNRLIAEKNNPQADVYWANEPIRAEVLRQKGILTPYKSPNSKGIPSKYSQKDFYWSGFSARIRLIVAEENLSPAPHSILDYTNPLFKAKAVIANPLFGTTTAHIAALFELLGEEKAKTFLTALKANETTISTSNGESADFVAAKSYAFSLVDSDDAVSRMREGKKLTFIYPDQGENDIGIFVVPNAIMMINKAPHPTNAKKLIDYLLSPKSEKKLAFADCAQIPLHPNVPMPKTLKSIDQLKVMPVDFSKVAQKLIEIQPYLKDWL